MTSFQVNDEECFVWARRLAKQEGIFTGGSGGGCMAGALKVARDAKKGEVIVAFLPDTGTRYLSKIYNDGWMREYGYVDAEVAPHRRRRHPRTSARAAKRATSSSCGPDQTVFHALQHHAEAGYFADSGLRRRTSRSAPSTKIKS